MTSPRGSDTFAERSPVTGTCLIMLRHSSGALVLFRREYGAYLRVSIDMGQTWGPEYRVSPVNPMAAMTELPDGREKTWQ